MTKYTYTDSFAPDSVLIDSAFYHKGEKNLFVKFHGSAAYGYAKVPENVWEQFYRAASAGSFYNLNIKGKYGTIEDIESISYIAAKEPVAVETHKFVLVGHSPVEYTLEAATLEDAKADFARLFPEGVLKEVRVSFE